MTSQDGVTVGAVARSEATDVARSETPVGERSGGGAGTASAPPPSLVVMGPSGCGKTVVGRALARALQVPFTDGDDVHPAANVQKMSSGTPLTDDDRWPWLDVVGATLAHAAGGAVIACSALKRAYRDRIRSHDPAACFVLLNVADDELMRRMRGRTHFMPPALLRSQIDTLEPLTAAEGIAVTNTGQVDTVVAHILRHLTLTP